MVLGVEMTKMEDKLMATSCSATCRATCTVSSPTPTSADSTCHVAVQRNHPSKQKLWKHAQARQIENAGVLPVVQIVSFGSELSNRAPTFDMDLSDFMDGDKPISYERARQFFCRDPSQKWVAYVAGTILVLMTELGVQFTDSMSILVSSAVPEGKGVSSSASVEVATMSAIAAAYGLNITPRDLALLCQKTFKALLAAANTDEQLSALGELMYQCHYSYNACGLGSDGTDRLVNLVQEMQHRKTSQNGSPSVFGAKITGGGCGGSVCVIGKNCLKSTEEIVEVSSYAKLAVIVKFSKDTRRLLATDRLFSMDRLQALASLDKIRQRPSLAIGK